jgi:hypothetical protein
MIWVARYVKTTFPDYVPNVDSSDGGSESWRRLAYLTCAFDDNQILDYGLYELVTFDTT